jgi:hypothetical protein
MLYVGVFIVELVWSWLSNRANLSVIRRKPWRAGTYGLTSATMAWAIPMWVYLYTKDWTYAIPAILGDACGDWLAAYRKPKKKSKPKTPKKFDW